MAQGYIDGVLQDVPDVDETKRISEMGSIIREIRDRLLAEIDWWAVADRTMTQAEIDYRQALRDVPAQAGFPENVTWPTKP